MEDVSDDFNPDSLEVDTERLQIALNQLPDESRIVLVMFYFEDASYKEIAEQLQLKLGTVMSRLSRAKQRLRRLLAENDGQGNSNKHAVGTSGIGR
jgi:RNA polymerase sigma-70 factor (ECF subfamily)